MNTKKCIERYAELADQADQLSAQIAELQIAKKQFDNEMREIEAILKSDMIGAQLKRAVIAGWKLSLTSSTSTVIEEADLLPEAYWRIERNPDLMRVKEAMKNGELVPGAILRINQNLSLKKKDN